jgi:hypothetical protein
MSISYEKNLYFVDLVTFDRLEIQFVPDKLSYKPDSKFIAIESSGRNNPIYHYTGSEDTLTFRLDWHAKDEDRRDVIDKCRWLEALSKNNGWEEPPHPVMLVFGNLFETSTDNWLVTAAPYDLDNFRVASFMLPVQAYQEITLKRIANHNLDYKDIKAQSYKFIERLQPLPTNKVTVPISPLTQSLGF